MEVRPFRGWRFRPESGGNVSNLIAPPYDVLDQSDKDALLARSEHNIVAIDLPHMPPKELGPDSAYIAAAERLAQWKDEGVLQAEAGAALYVYEQTYTWAGTQHTRRALLAGVRATPFGEDIIPHEHTFAGPKADRMRLTEVTRTQLSPIFAFHEDPSGVVGREIAAAVNQPPVAVAEISGVAERLWTISDPNAIGRVRTALADVPAYIADGHHRYTTAMNYADHLAETENIGPDHEARFVLFALVASDDPGLIVLPTHRLVSGLNDEFNLDGLIAAAEAFEFTEVGVADVDLADADAFLSGYGKTAMLFVGAEGKRAVMGVLQDPDAMVAAAPDQPQPWRELDVAILQELILERALKPFRTDSYDVAYTPDGNVAVASVREGKAQLACCLQGTPLSAVKDVADASGFMPHKSTYFYPKISTGMVLKPLQ